MVGDDKGSFEFRRQSQRVFVDSGDVILRLHKTDIVRVKANGDVTLSTGGWATPKTMHSMNDALELFGMWVESIPGRRIPLGHWQVTDSDGTVHPYTNNEDDYIITIRSKGGDDRQRAQWLAEAYEVPYTPPAAAAQTSSRAPAGPRIVSAQPAAARSALAASTAPTPAVAVPPRVPIGGSWANIAKAATPSHQANTGAAAASAGRVTGPGAASGARTTGPGAAAAPSATHRTTGPPGLHGSSGYGGGSSSMAAAALPLRPQWQQQRQPAAAAAGASTAAVMSAPAPPQPADPHRVLQQFTAMGMDHHFIEDEADTCVVCMEEPRSTVLVPCGHMVLCKDCCKHIIETRQGKCPVCQQDVEYSVEVNS